MKIVIKFIVLLAILLLNLKGLSQEIELLRSKMTQEDYMVLLIDSLEYSQSASDTADVVRFSRILITEFQSARMKERALEYLNLALLYSSNYSDPAPYFDVCNGAGMYYSSRMRDKGLNSPHYINMIKEERKWHNRAIYNDVENEQATFWGHFGVLMNMSMVFSDNGIKNDSVHYHFQKMEEISKKDSTISLIPASKNYIDYLIFTDNFEKADSIITGMLPHLSGMERKNKSGFYNAIHDLLARRNKLDTLIQLRNKSVSLFSEVVGANHADKLYGADQKYEVTKTKDQLEDTEGELFQSKRVLTVSIIIALLIAFTSIYFYYLNGKNKQLSKRNELLLKEQNHRVKNNLQMINSLLSLQSQKLLSTDAKEALNESQLRINSVALLHRMLYEGDQLGQVNTKEYLTTLTDEINYAVPRQVELKLEIPNSLELAIEKATSLGLIINELMTNSIKHVDEKIELTINITLNESNNQLILTYADNGSGISEEAWNTSKSFGNQLIRIQSEQLRGSYHIKGSDGFRYELKLGA